VFDFVEGAVLAEVEPDAAQLATAGRILGRIDVVLESFTHPAAQRGLVWDIRLFHEMTGLVEHTTNAEHRQLAQEIFRLFGQAIVPRLNDLETQVIHGDYSPYNVVVDPQSDDFVTGVIDFGDTARSAVIFDPAVCVANLLGRVPDQPWRDAWAFVTGYDRARPIKHRELPLLPVAGLARLTLRALITNWRAERVPATTCSTMPRTTGSTWSEPWPYPSTTSSHSSERAVTNVAEPVARLLARARG
jgi:hydroxylysine kinase